MKTYLKVSTLVTPAALSEYYQRINKMSAEEGKAKVASVCDKYAEYLPVLIHHSFDTASYSGGVAVLTAIFEILDEKLNEYNSKGN